MPHEQEAFCNSVSSIRSVRKPICIAYAGDGHMDLVPQNGGVVDVCVQVCRCAMYAWWGFDIVAARAKWGLDVGTRRLPCTLFSLSRRRLRARILGRLWGVCGSVSECGCVCGCGCGCVA